MVDGANKYESANTGCGGLASQIGRPERISVSIIAYFCSPRITKNVHPGCRVDHDVHAFERQRPIRIRRQVANKQLTHF
jgi:hypothetical protein